MKVTKILYEEYSFSLQSETYFAGANVNSSSPIIGSPLHVVCADSIPNRLELLHLLLCAGADPNMVIESDEGPPLRPVLAEYIASNEDPRPDIVHLLLRFGAKVSHS
jgi:hypothetical protein